ncbi:MAG: hypothetical protein L0Y60_07620 [Beijerinckiaceae bacterium]|nr:hypothetical protein [Beijerinckiaceae bacterium]
MSIHSHGTNDPMSFEAAARGWVIEIEAHHVRTAGHPLPVARKNLARKLGVAPGTLENIRRGRIKNIRLLTASRLRSFMIRHLQSEIQKHSHDLEMVLRSSEDARADEILEAQAALARARILLVQAAR